MVKKYEIVAHPECIIWEVRDESGNTAIVKTGLTPDEAEDEDIETVGGLVSAIAGRVPQRGEVIPHPGGWDFEVLDADPRRVKRLRVRRIEVIKPDLAALAAAAGEGTG